MYPSAGLYERATEWKYGMKEQTNEVQYHNYFTSRSCCNKKIIIKSLQLLRLSSCNLFLRVPLVLGIISEGLNGSMDRRSERIKRNPQLVYKLQLLQTKKL